jgi:hypothetical protein
LALKTGEWTISWADVWAGGNHLPGPSHCLAHSYSLAFLHFSPSVKKRGTLWGHLHPRPPLPRQNLLA